MLLDENWLLENYTKGTLENTSEGMKVYVKGMDFWDEVLYSHIVIRVLIDGIESYEANPSYSIPPSERGVQHHKQWFIKK